MTIPPIFVATARSSWKWQWNQLMNGLAPANKDGQYIRPPSQKQKATLPETENLLARTSDRKPLLIIGRSCPWAHRTWLLYKLRNLQSNLNLIIAKANHKEGRWQIDPPWMGCNSLLEIYKLCNCPPSYRATVPALIDPGTSTEEKPKLLGNESAQLVEILNLWPTTNKAHNLRPIELEDKMANWQKILQPRVNDGVYRCGFARNQMAYDKASTELFNALGLVEKSLRNHGPWLCGKKLSLADIRLFPTLIRWEMVYMPLFGCSQQPLWNFPNLWKWRQRFFNLPEVASTCDSVAWRNDYFGALFPLNPSCIVPSGPDLHTIVNTKGPVI